MFLFEILSIRGAQNTKKLFKKYQYVCPWPASKHVIWVNIIAYAREIIFKIDICHNKRTPKKTTPTIISITIVSKIDFGVLFE